MNRFTHARIRPFFSGCGRLIMNTLDDIVSKRIPLENLPMITVISNNGFYFSLNNRRLFVLKTLRDQGNHFTSRLNHILHQYFYAIYS